ncbi:MAG: zinc metallopeptidase [Saprospiraceae bacterium]|nr:zinc metallopeptidase [Saprospiraceae bacterium]MBK8632039.1 zinc metallopeptidase [Saprospiraceae bacterium]
MILYWVILGVFTLIGFLVSNRLKSKFENYSHIGIRSNLSGAEVAVKMLRHYGINDVRVEMGEGMLTDHYNPTNKTIALSPAVYGGRSIASAAVAAHECGHAVQHAQSYSMLALRSNLVPVMQFSSKVQQFMFMGMMFGVGMGIGGNLLMMVLVITFGVTALFSLVTLPVEFDASKRALVWLDESNVAAGQEYDGAKDALWWAAMTYVAQALGALVMFLYFLLSFLGNRD